MKKSKIFFIIILYLFFWFLGKIFAQNNGSYNINYSENFPNNIGIFQSLNNGWATARNNYKNIMTPEWCRKITSNRNELFFIPTKTTNEWNNFKSHLPSGIGIGSCDLICNPNFHKEWNSCISNTKSCTITNWTWNQIWNGSSWWSCQVMSCDSWYENKNNSCIENLQICKRWRWWFKRYYEYWIKNWDYCDTICWTNQHLEQWKWRTCINNTRSCGITNWTGQQEWNIANDIWWSCQVVSCDSWYNKVWNSCIKINNNCSTINMNGYNIPAVNHWNSTQITKTINWNPANGSTSYTATANCNNGNITIAWESSRISCGSGYNLSWNSCVIVDKLKQLFPDYTRPKAWTKIWIIDFGLYDVSEIYNLPKNTHVIITDDSWFKYDEWVTSNEWKIYYNQHLELSDLYYVKLKNYPDVIIYKFTWPTWMKYWDTANAYVVD